MSEAVAGDKLKRNPLLITLVIFMVLAGAFVGFAMIWTDWLWFSTLNLGVVFTTQLAAKIGLFLGFGLISAGTVSVSALIAFRLRPRTRARKDESVFFQRFSEAMDRRPLALAVGPALAVGLLAGLSGSANTEVFLAWLNGTSFGKSDPYFGLDISFYIFSYPWWQIVISFLLLTLWLGLITTVFVHFMTGAISGISFRRREARGQRSPAQVQLSVMAGLLMICYGFSMLLDRLGLSVRNGEKFTGVHYTDANSRMSALLILAIIAFICAALFLVNAVLQMWNIPLTALGLMIIAGLLLNGVYPWWMQTFNVRPNEQDKESSFIVNNLKATQEAFGLDRLKIEDYQAVATVSAGQLRTDAEALPSIRLMDPAVVGQTFEQLQQVRGYYVFPNKLDIDRYTINGVDTDAVVAARELDISRVSETNWNNTHTVYTHGFGLVAAYGNRREINGEPQFLAGGIPTVGVLPEHEPRIYFGEKSGHYVVVGAPEGAEPVELDTPGGNDGKTETNSTFKGSTGVPVGGFFNRLLFSIKFADLNLLLTDRVNSESVVLFDRMPAERVQKVAPWLKVDSDIYPTVVDGRIKWVVDAYTTANTYPNSTSVDWRAVTSDTGTSSGTSSDPVNYARNSVKATVDAYDGTVTLYAWDEEDPVLQTWQKVYPNMVKPRSEISADLLKHLRYPQDLFKAQRETLSRYHTNSPTTWFQNSDVWEVPADPTKGQQNQARQQNATSNPGSDSQVKEPPYFLTIKWPGDEDPVFSQTSVFVPLQRHNLSVFMAVNSDASSPNYGQMRMLKLSDSQQIAGPAQTFNAISTDGKVAEQLLPFTRQGNTKTIYGNLLTLPVGGGLLYVQPIYTQTSDVTGAYPALRFVAVRFGEQIGIGATLQEALDKVFQGDSGARTGENLAGQTGTTTTPSPVPTTGQPQKPEPTTAPTGNAAAQQLLGEAARLFDEADAALKSGDLAGYQAKNKEAKGKVEEAMKVIGG